MLPNGTSHIIQQCCLHQGNEANNFTDQTDHEKTTSKVRARIVGVLSRPQRLR